MATPSGDASGVIVPSLSMNALVRAQFSPLMAVAVVISLAFIFSKVENFVCHFICPSITLGILNVINGENDLHNSSELKIVCVSF